MPAISSEPLPCNLRSLFPELDFAALRWPRDRAVVMRRVLMDGGWEANAWLRGEVGDEGIRDWILEREGRGLSPMRLRFWDLVVGLPGVAVDRWVRESRRDPWHRRHRILAER